MKRKAKVIDMDQNIEIKSIVSFNRMTTLVRDIAEELFDAQGEYLPEHYDYIFWVNVSSVYAGVGIDMTADEFLEKLYTGWMDELKQAINTKQLAAIESAVNERISVRLNKHPMEAVATSLVELINGVNNQVSEDNAQKMLDAIKEVKEINAESLVEAMMKNQK